MCAACANKRLGEWQFDNHNRSKPASAQSLEVEMLSDAEAVAIDAAVAAARAEQA